LPSAGRCQPVARYQVLLGKPRHTAPPPPRSAPLSSPQSPAPGLPLSSPSVHVVPVPVRPRPAPARTPDGHARNAPPPRCILPARHILALVPLAGAPRRKLPRSARPCLSAPHLFEPPPSVGELFQRPE